MQASLSLHEIERRMFDLLASCFTGLSELNTWVLNGQAIPLPYTQSLSPEQSLAFHTKIELAGSDRWLLRVDVTGNGELYLDGELYQAVDEYHRLAPVPPGKHSLTVSITPRRLFGESPWSVTFWGGAVASVLWDEFAKTLALLDLIPIARKNDEAKRALGRALSHVTLTPSVLQVYSLSRMLYGALFQEQNPELRGLRWDYAYMASVYGPVIARGLAVDLRGPDPGEVKRTVGEVYEELKPLLESRVRGGLIYLFGHAHIDTAWLWPYSETRRKIKRTFSTVVRLAEMGYRFTYLQSGAQNYEWLEETDKELFEKVRKLVEKGVWLPVGGMWVESDTQLLTGESLARQFLYGQRYFLERFGKTCRIGWLPDSFGFSAQLPQLLKKAGLEVFVTHKVMWNDTNPFPHHAFVWKALDGSEVVSHILVQSYNGALTAEELLSLWDRYKEKDSFPVAVHAYGFGDGGGGPTFTMLERLKLLEKLNLLPGLVSSPREEDYVSTLLSAKGSLPVWMGEIYNEFHRGVYTTNLRIKQLVAEAENEAIWADHLGALLLLEGEPLVFETVKYWKTILRNQFHDVLPGSSCREAYEEAYQELEKTIRDLKNVSRRIAESLAERVKAPRGSAVILNRLPWQVVYVVELPSCRYTSDAILACQEKDKGAVAVVKVPALGYTTLFPASQGSQRGRALAYPVEDGVVLENETVTIKIDRRGYLRGLALKQDSFNYLEKGELRVHVDKPGAFDAWDIDRSAFQLPSDQLELVEGPEIISRGPAFASARLSFRYGLSTVELEVRVYSGLSLVELDFDFDWWEKSRLLKLWLDSTIHSDVAHCHVPFGVVERRTSPVDRRAEAMFEVPALHWVDLSDGQHGLALIAIDRHGYSFEGKRIGLSLLKSPTMPNPWSDTGKMSTKVYLYPHTGDYVSGNVYRMAYAVFSGVKIVEKSGEMGSEPPEHSFFEVNGGVLESLKRAENSESGVVARLYDITGGGADVNIRLPIKVDVHEVDLVELHPKLIHKEADSFRIKLAPFEIKTLLITRKK
ncbi:MAG: glycoside hydrolase family 38 C-terminal domain-containing protein [Infirmifilum sp.]